MPGIPKSKRCQSCRRRKIKVGEWNLQLVPARPHVAAVAAAAAPPLPRVTSKRKTEQSRLKKR
jgi:hypothetical protein